MAIFRMMRRKREPSLRGRILLFPVRGSDDDLVYRKRLRRRLEDYKRNVPPHVQAARKLASHGSTIRYVKTCNGPEPVGGLQSVPDYQHYLDKQLAPAADGILQFLDTSFGDLTDSQMQMF